MIMKGKVSLLYLQVGVAESTSVAVGFAIRATVGHIFQGADRRDFFEVLAEGLHTGNRYESLRQRANCDPPAQGTTHH